MLESNLLIINDYIDYLKYERKLSINTTSSYYNNLYLFSKYINNKDILNINSKDIRDFIYSIDKSSKTKAHYLSVLNSFYNYLINIEKKKTNNNENNNECININPCNTVKMPKMEKTLPNYLTTEEIDKLFNIRLTKPLDYRNKAMLELLYATGTRISELINLTFSQVDFADCTLRVMGKGKKERLIPISDNALEYLLLYINEYRPFILKTKTSDYIFINRDGHMISRQGFFKILKDLCKKAGIKKNISPHTLRHSFATHLLNNGADLRVIQEFLGHENLTTTEIYSHLQNKKIVDDYTNHPRAMIEKGIK